MMVVRVTAVSGRHTRPTTSYSNWSLKEELDEVEQEIRSSLPVVPVLAVLLEGVV